MPLFRKTTGLYIALQIATLVACWGWFAGVWFIAFISYSPLDFEWWVLVILASMGVYGLRPNLERAIDAAWLQGQDKREALAERAAQLRPIKRRIDVIFSLVILAVLFCATILWFTGVIQIDTGTAGSLPQ